MEPVRLRKATIEDRSMAIDLDYQLDKTEHVELHRAEKITQAIVNNECFLILLNKQAVGFVLFDYRFFDQGWIELIIIDEEFRGKGIGGKVFDLLVDQCKSEKVFTSTNRSNTRMQRALHKAGFTFAGELIGLDDDDPERFYFRLTS